MKASSLIAPKWCLLTHTRAIPKTVTNPFALLVFLVINLLPGNGVCQTITLRSIGDARYTGNDNGYTLDGDKMLHSSRTKLQNPDNFGATGTYPKNVFIVDGYSASGNLTQISSTASPNDLFFFGSFNMSSPGLQQFTLAEIDSLYNWSKRGGKLIIAHSASAPQQGGGLYDSKVLASKWGFDIILDFTTMIIPTATGTNTSIFNGPFGTVNYAYQGGTAQGFFFTTPPNSVVLARSIAGDPTLMVDCNTLDLIIADVDPYTIIGGITNGPLISGSQDVFFANTIAFMDQLESPPVITTSGYMLSTGNYTAYQWYLNGTPISGATAQSLDVDSNGTYTVKVTLSCTCEVMSDSVVVSDYQSIFHVNASHTNAHCGACNGTAYATALMGMPPYSYVWSIGDTTSAIGPICAGVYSVTVTDMNLATVTASVTITDDTVTTATISATQMVICAGDSSALCINGTFTDYHWNNGKTNSCIYVKDAGNYYVIATDNSGCTVESNHLAISVNVPPPVSVSVNGDTLTAYGALAYQWYLNDNPIPGATSNILIANDDGLYAVMVIDSNGCNSFSSSIFVSSVLKPLSVPDVVVRLSPNNTWQLQAGTDWLGSQIEIIDIIGKQVYTSVIENRESELSFPCASGVYVCWVHGRQGTVSLKLLKL